MGEAFEVCVKKARETNRMSALGLDATCAFVTAPKVPPTATTFAGTTLL